MKTSNSKIRRITAQNNDIENGYSWPLENFLVTLKKVVVSRSQTSKQLIFIVVKIHSFICVIHKKTFVMLCIQY